MNTPTLALKAIGACKEARDWSTHYDTLRECWFGCERGHWLLWFAAAIEADKKTVTRAACECARDVIERSKSTHFREALAVADQWVDDDGPISAVQNSQSRADYWAAWFGVRGESEQSSIGYSVAYALAYAVGKEHVEWSAMHAADLYSVKVENPNRIAFLRLCAYRIREVLPWNAISRAIKKSKVLEAHVEQDESEPSIDPKLQSVER